MTDRSDPDAHLDIPPFLDRREPAFTEDIARDVILLRAALAGSIDAVRAAAMLMPDFAGGPDTVTAYAKWMSHPDREPYRAKVAEALEAGESHAL